MGTFLHELLHVGIYKRSQGRITRQVTFAALAAAIALGLLRLSSIMAGKRARSTSLRPAAGCCWRPACGSSYRLVNLPAFADFLIAVEAEMNKVSWPTRTELFRASIVVLIMMFALAFILSGFDFVLGYCYRGYWASLGIRGCDGRPEHGRTGSRRGSAAGDEAAAGGGLAAPTPPAGDGGSAAARRHAAGGRGTGRRPWQADRRCGAARPQRRLPAEHHGRTARRRGGPAEPPAADRCRSRRPTPPTPSRSRNRTRWIGTSSRCRATARSRSAKGCCGGWPSPGWDLTSAK